MIPMMSLLGKQLVGAAQYMIVDMVLLILIKVSLQWQNIAMVHILIMVQFMNVMAIPIRENGFKKQGTILILPQHVWMRDIFGSMRVVMHVVYVLALVLFMVSLKIAVKLIWMNVVSAALKWAKWALAFQIQAIVWVIQAVRFLRMIRMHVKIVRMD
jgi:hypothetical protein